MLASSPANLACSALRASKVSAARILATKASTLSATPFATPYGLLASNVIAALALGSPSFAITRSI